MDGDGDGDDSYNVGGWNESGGGIDSSGGDGGLNIACSVDTDNGAATAVDTAPWQERYGTGSDTGIIAPSTTTTYPVALAAVGTITSTPGAIATTSKTTTASTTSEDSLFPQRLHLMLHDADGQGGGGGGGGGFSNVVSWGQDSPHNFKVHNKRQFERQVLPKYFKMTKYKSFTRQLHNYDFQWIRRGNDKGGCTFVFFFCVCVCVIVCSLARLFGCLIGI